LADLAWGSLWDLAVGTKWLALQAESRASAQPASLATLPYTQPDSPAGWLFRWLNRLVGWWRNGFWPNAGPVLLGLLAAVVLTVVLSLLLPDRLRPLNVALVVLLVVGLLQQWCGQAPLVSQAFVLVALSWLVGYLAFAELGWPSLVLALSFAVSAWGVLRVVSGGAPERMEGVPSEQVEGVRPEQVERVRGGLWLLNAGQVVGVVLLVVLKQPLAAGAMGLLLFGQIALQPSLRHGGDQAQIMRRAWPWLMVAMLVAALALP
jgi:hypothetical protein